MTDRSYGTEIIPQKIYSVADLRLAFGFDSDKLTADLKAGRLKSIDRAGAVLVRGSDLVEYLST